MPVDPDMLLEDAYDCSLLSTRTYNALRHESGCTTLRAAFHIPDSELLRIPNFGKVSLAELKAIRDQVPKDKLVLDPVIVEIRQLGSRISALESAIGVLRKKLATHQDDLLFLFKGFKQ